MYLAIALLVLLGGLLGPVGTASGQTWVTNGPGGGIVTSLAVDPKTPTTIYAGTSGAGIFKSTNAGGNWNAINNGLLSGGTRIAHFALNLGIATLAIDPVTPATVYAGTLGGLFKSIDGGASWSFVTITLSGAVIVESTIDALAIDPKTPTTIYAGSPISSGQGGGLFKSTDGGATWAAINSGLPGAPVPSVTALVIDPLTPTTLYTVVGDVFKSTDGGASWTSAGIGQSGTHIPSLAIDPATPTTLYAAVAPNAGGGLGLFKSTNGGGSWSEILSGVIWFVAVDPATPTTVYAVNPNGPMYKSTDAGATWSTIASPPGQGANAFAFGINAPNPTTIYAAGGFFGGGVLNGVFKSTDGGASWSAVNSGLSNTRVSTLAIDPMTPTTIYAGTSDGSGGVFKSTDGGISWIAANSGLPCLPNFGAASLAIDPSAPSTLYVAGNGVGGGACGVFKSTNAGGSWNPAGSGLPFGVSSLAINPKTPTTIYVGTFGSGVFRSTDGGGSWTAVNTGLTGNSLDATRLAIDPLTPTTIYIGSFAAGVFKSTNGGGSWTAANTGLTVIYVNAVAINPVTPSTLYAGTNGGVFKSTDGGASWAATNMPTTTYVNALAIDPITPTILYAAIGDALNPGTTTFGILESTDEGGTWSAIDAGLTAISVSPLAIDSTGSKIFAGTSGGVFSTTAGRSVNQTTTTLVSSPNPSTPGQSVTFTATVTSGSGTPTGTVLFTYQGELFANDGTTSLGLQPLLLGTVPLNAGVASLSVSSFGVGSYTIAGVYQPDTISFEGSTSAFLTQTVAIASVVPTTLTFAAQDIGTTSASQPVTLMNIGNGTLTISGIASSGDFSQTNTCGSSVAAKGSCTISVTFTPTASGVRFGTLTITDSNNPVASSTQTVSLIGSGGQPSVVLNPSSVSFASRLVGTSTSGGLVAVSNTGSGPLIFASIVVTGDFAVASSGTTCSTSAPLPASTSCMIDLAFTPTAAGTRSGSLTLNDNASGSPQTVSLTGTGTAPEAELSITALAFTAVQVNSTSSSQAVTLSNTGNLDLAVAGISTSRNFAQTNNCGGSVAPNASCTINVTFTPLAGGPLGGALTITDNSNNTTGSTQTVALTGAGQDFSFAPPSGSSTSATVSPGQPATYTLSVGGQGGLTGTISFTCTGAPSQATCTVSPNPATAGSSATNVTVTVTTTAPTLAAPRSRPLPPVLPFSPGPRGLLMLALVLAAMAWSAAHRNQLRVRRGRSTMVLLASGWLLTLGLAGCGGGGGGGGTTHNPGTPAGTYTLTVTGAAGSGSSALRHSVTLTLTVS